MTVLVDTGGILAIVNAGDPRHRDVMAFVTTTRESLVVPVTVLPEVDYMLSTRLGARAAISAMASIVDGDFNLEQVTVADLARSVELMRQYADSDIGLVDASIVALAERLRVTKILTLDRRHFGQI